MAIVDPRSTTGTSSTELFPQVWQLRRWHSAHKYNSKEIYEDNDAASKAGVEMDLCEDDVEDCTIHLFI
jgi:hypothetical protein